MSAEQKLAERRARKTPELYLNIFLMSELKLNIRVTSADIPITNGKPNILVANLSCF